MRSMKNVKYLKDGDKTITNDLDLFDISFMKRDDYFKNVDNYVKFVKSVEKLVRKHPDYDMFVSQVREERIEHCQILGHISRYDATIEMHHGPMFTLFDYGAIITNYHVFKGEAINTFMIAKELLDAHFDNMVQVVMLCKTAHQAIDTGEIFINLNQGIGDVMKFIEKYRSGMDNILIQKVNDYIDLSKKFESTDNNIFELEDEMISWSYRDQPSSLAM